MKIISYIFKTAAISLFLVLLGGIIFKVTHIPYTESDGNVREIVSESGENEELIYNSKSAQNVINEIKGINGIETVSVFELDGNVLIGIETVLFENEYKKALESFSKGMASEYLGIKYENVFVEINTSFTDDISELSYYAGRGLDANILNSRFNGIYTELLESEMYS